ncbi:MAG TPA: type III-A CRISPR-associated protein Csm2 [Thermodesulfobacteriota bacterium]|nr:type III-A CRISPR-associated protein Csm2 [Thermodesulfobacteriota bacterium]
MLKKCEQCGKAFEASQPYHKTCPECFTSRKSSEVPAEFLLETYFDEKGNFLREVFIGLPEILAKRFAGSGLSTKQLRDFHLLITRARNKAFLQEINVAKPILWECERNVFYQLKRNAIPPNFARFLEHHLRLAEKNQNMLDGFCQHLESIIAYFPKEKGGKQ